MPKRIAAFLACACHGARIHTPQERLGRPSSGTNFGDDWDELQRNVQGDSIISPLSAIAVAFLRLNPASAFMPSGPRLSAANGKFASRSSLLHMETKTESDESGTLAYRSPQTEADEKVRKRDWDEMLAQGSPETLPSTNEEWKSVLPTMPYMILREEATEPPFSSELNDVKEPGVFLCAGCAQPLFTTSAKFDSGTGWPSFYAPVGESSIDEKTDYKLILPRTETVCSRCKGHLGHVFSDGPQPTGKRYCMNGRALRFESGSERAELAQANFAAAAKALKPPLVTTAIETGLTGLLFIGALWSLWVNSQAGAGALWAKEFLQSAFFPVHFGSNGKSILWGLLATYQLNMKVPLLMSAFESDD